MRSYLWVGLDNTLFIYRNHLQLFWGWTSQKHFQIFGILYLFHTCNIRAIKLCSIVHLLVLKCTQDKIHKQIFMKLANLILSI